MKAIDYFNMNFNCAESVLKSNIKDINSSVATPFGGGIANTNHICGALTGGLLVIGFLKGRNDSLVPQDEVKKVSKTLIEEFEINFNATCCNDLTGCDLTTKDGLEKFKLPERRKRCNEFVNFVDDFVKENIL